MSSSSQRKQIALIGATEHPQAFIAVFDKRKRERLRKRDPLIALMFAIETHRWLSGNGDGEHMIHELAARVLDRNGIKMTKTRPGDYNSGFFFDFANHRFFQRLSRIHFAAGQSPSAALRRIFSPVEKQKIALGLEEAAHYFKKRTKMYRNDFVDHKYRARTQGSD